MNVSPYLVFLSIIGDFFSSCLQSITGSPPTGLECHVKVVSFLNILWSCHCKWSYYSTMNGCIICIEQNIHQFPTLGSLAVSTILHNGIEHKRIFSCCLPAVVIKSLVRTLQFFIPWCCLSLALWLFVIIPVLLLYSSRFVRRPLVALYVISQVL